MGKCLPTTTDGLGAKLRLVSSAVRRGACVCDPVTICIIRDRALSVLPAGESLRARAVIRDRSTSSTTILLQQESRPRSCRL